MKKVWEIQICRNNPWISFGFHIDHTDPSITVHLPFRIFYIGYCKQPGFNSQSRRGDESE